MNDAKTDIETLLEGISDEDVKKFKERMGLKIDDTELLPKYKAEDELINDKMRR